MPYPNEHAARINNPDKYVKFRRDNDAFGAGIDAIYGITEDGTTELQAIRFASDKFTAAEAHDWLKEHDYKPIEFEEASGEKANGEKASGGKSIDIRNSIRRVACKELVTVSAAARPDESFGYIEGYAAVWDNIDEQSEIIRRGAFAKSIRERVPTGKIKLQVQHVGFATSTLDTIGTVIEAKEDERGLWIRAALAPTERAQELRKLVQSGHVHGLSVGFMALQAGPAVEGGKSIIEHKEGKLLEVTVTPFPANEEAVILAVKSLITEPQPRGDELRRLLSGIDATAIDRIVKALQSLSQSTNTSDIEAVVTRIRAEQRNRETELSVWAAL